MRRAVALFGLTAILMACQSLTSLSDLDFQATTLDAAMDASGPHMDVTPPAAHVTIDGGPSDSGARCVIAEGAECDLVSQCGCQAGQHCQARTSLLRPMCVDPGSNVPWSGCRLDRECPAGQACDSGSCRTYCNHDEDCDGGRCFAYAGSDAAAESGIHVCWRECRTDQPDACATGTSCRTLQAPDGKSGTYCAAPLDPCPTEEDGTCDDPSGTGTCADGTDRKDCDCTPTLPTAPCDPVKQCGCAKGLTCDLQTLDTNLNDDNVFTLTGMCTKPGKKALYAACSDVTECSLGLTCDLNLRMCVNICSKDADCVGGGCKRFPNKDDPHIGVCSPMCDRATNAPCTPGTVCATFNEEWRFSFATPGNYCWKPVMSDCPTNEGCDEPQGTGICAAGTDTHDCCTPPPLNGECNHVTGCGCAAKPETQCRHDAFSGTTSCGVKGTDPPWSLCTGLGDNCPPGYACGEGVCRKYCSSAQDCAGPEDICVQFLDFSGDAIKGVGGCFSACDFDDENSCPKGLTCAQTSPPEAYCLKPYDPCPDIYLNNGRCDDPRGTRTCAMGTDPECDSSQ